MSSKTIYTMFHTPSHGYLRVDRAEFERSGVEASQYSYQNERFVYLEEDADAPAYLEYLEHDKGLDVRTEDVHLEYELRHLDAKLTPIAGNLQTDIKRAFARLNELQNKLGTAIAELESMMRESNE